MKNAIISLLFSTIIISANGQMSGTYVSDLGRKVQYYLGFFNDGQYYLNVTENLTLDISCVTNYSIGKYIIDHDVIRLNDRIHKFQFEFLKNGDTIITKKSYVFLQGKAFAFKSDYSDESSLKQLRMYDSLTIHLERSEYKENHHRIFPLYNKYVSEDTRWCSKKYDLALNHDSTYHLLSKEILISEGTWSRKGVELILFDKWLQKRFYLLIGKRVAISKLLPGDYESVILKGSD